MKFMRVRQQVNFSMERDDWEKLKVVLRAAGTTISPWLRELVQREMLQMGKTEPRTRTLAG